MVQRHSIPHFQPMIVDIINPEGQGRGNIRSLSRILLLKSTFFTKSGRGRPITKPRSQYSEFKMPIIRAFKKGIACFLLFLVLSKFDENQN